ncbi:MAG: molybdopterin molybdotransferase MoeA [Actinobacteria bacterium]|nr:molybdopterin molybdotransferase MoeA [Actinomycetota bacterium]
MAHEPAADRDRSGDHHGHDDHRDGHGPVEGLLPVEEARDRLLSLVDPLAPIDLPLQEAYGCVAAADVVAGEDLPSFSSSAMDGFAVRSREVAGATPDSPVELRIVGRALIGHRPDATVGGGEAVRIATGAPVPAGADCIVPIEDCAVQGETVAVLRPSTEGRHVRPAGEDVRSGDLLVPTGRRISGAEMGLLANAGRSTVTAYPRPRVVVISTGDELVEPWQPTSFGQVRDANSFTIAGMLKEAGAVPFLAGIVRDDVDQLKDTILGQLIQADAFISSGGVSVGERDVVKQAFFRRGDIDFYRVAMQPGMPQAFGRIEGKPYFGLPGNPVSVFVSFEVFIRPALMRMMGRPNLFRPEVTASMDDDISGARDKTVFSRVHVRATAEGYLARSTGGRGSNLMATVSRANGLAIIPPGTERVAAGERCRVMLFRSLES